MSAQIRPSTWLTRNSPQLGALTLSASCSDWKHVERIARALCILAEAAAVEGRPLPLHTFRVLGQPGQPMPTGMDVTGGLLAHLPKLHCLQLDLSLNYSLSHEQMHAAVLECLGPFQQATALEELYLIGPPDGASCGSVAQLLPGSLKRLSWRPADKVNSVPDLSHLSQLGVLKLERWVLQQQSFSSKLPPGLQELQLSNMNTPLTELQQEEHVLTGYTVGAVLSSSLGVLPTFTCLQSMSYGYAGVFEDPQVCTVMQQLPGLLSLDVQAQQAVGSMHTALQAAPSYHNLRRLHLSLWCLPQPTGLAALTQLTWLAVSSSGCSSSEQQHAWAEELGRMPALKWLSVPDVLLVGEQAWVGGLQQLQVLVLNREEQMLFPEEQARVAQVLQQVVEALEGCSPKALPPTLLLLGFSHMTAEQAVSWQVRRRLRQLVGSSGCEVVVGFDLDEVCDPVKQLAGLPVALQRALA